MCADGPRAFTYDSHPCLSQLLNFDFIGLGAALAFSISFIVTNIQLILRKTKYLLWVRVLEAQVHDQMVLLLWACKITTGACSEQIHFTHSEETRERREMGFHTSSDLRSTGQTPHPNGSITHQQHHPKCRSFKVGALQGHLKQTVIAGYNRHPQINSLNTELFLKSIMNLVL